MHHKYDLILKDGFSNAHIAAGVNFQKKIHHKQRGLKNVKFCRLTFPPLLAQITSSNHNSWPLSHISARRRKKLPEEEEK